MWGLDKAKGGLIQFLSILAKKQLDYEILKVFFKGLSRDAYSNEFMYISGLEEGLQGH